MKYQETKKFNKLMDKAIEKEDVLFPHDALDLLKSGYGKRLENIKFCVIYEMINDLCLRNGHEADQEEIEEVLNDYMNED